MGPTVVAADSLVAVEEDAVEDLKEAYEDKRPRAGVDALIEEMSTVDGIDFED